MAENSTEQDEVIPQSVPNVEAMGYPMGDSIYGLAEQVAQEQEARDAIPSLTEDSSQVLQKKVPSFWAYLLGEQVIPDSVEPEVKRKRGRPRKHGRAKKIDRRENKIEHALATHKILSHQVEQQVIEEVEHRIKYDFLLSHLTIRKMVADKFGLTYNQVYDLTKHLTC